MNRQFKQGGMGHTQTVYIDVLIGVNLFINYFLLLAVARFLHIPAKRGRMVAAAGLGAFYALSIFLPELFPILSVLVKLLMSATIVLTAFPFFGWKPFLRALAGFYLTSFAFAGFMLCLWYFVAPQGLFIKNSIVYFDISPLFLLCATVGCYGVIRLIQRATGRQHPEALFCKIIVRRNGKESCCTAKVDTGNTLMEPFSGFPVVVAQEEAVRDVIPPQEAQTAFRLIPYGAVGGEGVLPAFRPDKLVIRTEKKEIETRDVYIAVCREPLSNGEFGALLHPDLLS